MSVKNGHVKEPYEMSPHEDPGFKSRMCPPYPHACRKRRIKMRRRNIAQVADTALSTNLT